MANTISGSGSFSGAGTLSSPVVYSIGSTGPGGGIVFYDAGSTLSWGRYLEAATSATSPSWSDLLMPWSGNTNTLVGTSTAIGTGLANTNAAVAQNNTPNKAITICRSYTGGGKSDWFLPSKDELNQLYTQKTVVGEFTVNGYWSSSESSATNAINQYFDNGVQYTIDGKTTTLRVRPIRAF